MTPQEDNSWSHAPGFQIVLRLSFPFSNFVFMVINLNHAQNSVYISVSQSKSPELYHRVPDRPLFSQLFLKLCSTFQTLLPKYPCLLCKDSKQIYPLLRDSEPAHIPRKCGVQNHSLYFYDNLLVRLISTYNHICLFKSIFLVDTYVIRIDL